MQREPHVIMLLRLLMLLLMYPLPGMPTQMFKSDDAGAQPVQQQRRVVLPTARLPWPLPAVAKTGKQRVAVSPDFRFGCSTSCNAAACASPIVASAFSRYTTRLTSGVQAADVAGIAQLKSVVVCIESASEDLAQSTNESYQLRVYAQSPMESTISARTVFGAMRAMETLAQLMSLTSPGVIESCPVEIDDSPAYNYRGLMINPAKTFMPLEFIKRVVNGLVLNKLNVRTSSLNSVELSI